MIANIDENYFPPLSFNSNYIQLRNQARTYPIKVDTACNYDGRELLHDEAKYSIPNQLIPHPFIYFHHPLLTLIMII
jgi:hypothetical protein